MQNGVAKTNCSSVQMVKPVSILCISDKKTVKNKTSKRCFFSIFSVSKVFKIFCFYSHQLFWLIRYLLKIFSGFSKNDWLGWSKIPPIFRWNEFSSKIFMAPKDSQKFQGESEKQFLLMTPTSGWYLRFTSLSQLSGK